MAGIATLYSAHIGYLFTELPFRERIEAAKRYGFSAVEYPAPYGTPSGEMAVCLEQAGLTYVQFALRSGDATRGEKGVGIFPKQREEFRASVAEALAYARVIGVKLVHAMAGILPEAERRPEHWQQYVENLAYAADAAAVEGVTILVEPMSQQAVPDYFIQTPDHAAEAIAATQRMNIRLLFDVFHTASAGLNIFEQIERHAALIGHVHIAGVPGRHEPNSGALKLAPMRKALQGSGYRGFFGCEYTPADSTIEGLGWLAQAQG
jgi:hydroxypyruvate isomerase